MLTDGGRWSFLKPPRRFRNGDYTTLPRKSSDEESIIKLLKNYEECRHLGRRFMLSSQSLVGLVSKMACVGDQIFVLIGGEVPYILRPLDGGYYQLIGEW